MTPAQMEAKGYIERDGVWRRNLPRPEFFAAPEQQAIEEL